MVINKNEIDQSGSLEVRIAYKENSMGKEMKFQITNIHPSVDKTHLREQILTREVSAVSITITNTATCSGDFENFSIFPRNA